MSDSLTADEEREYAVIIDDILAQSDLNTVSAKAIRKGIQQKVDHDISAKKKPITDLIMSRFDKVTAERSGNTVVPTTETAPPPPPPPPAAPSVNGNGASASPPAKRETNGTSKKRSSPTPEEDEEELSSVADTPPPKKKKKYDKNQTETDAEYAARLHAELNRLERSTRGGGAAAKRKPVIKKQRKKKSRATVGSEDDSDAGSREKKEVKRTGGFHKPMSLSPQLAALVNETQLSRPQTVKKIWEYIKARDLQDPNDKRQIICDDAMRNVFKTDKVHMFTMNKIINTHLYEVEEV